MSELSHRLECWVDLSSSPRYLQGDLQWPSWGEREDATESNDTRRR